MDRIREYLNQCFDVYVMSEELKNLREEIMANATDHYEDRISQGETPEDAEAEVRASLGDIPALLREIGAEKKQENQTRFDPFANDTFQGLADSVNSLFNDLVRSQGKNGTQHEVYANIECIEINGISMDVHVSPSEDELLHASAEGNLDQISFEVEDNTLSIEESGSGKTLFQSALDLYLEIPADVRSLDVQVVSGDLTIANADLDSLRFQSASGDLSVKSGKIKDAAVKTASGDVELRLREMNRYYGELASGDADLRCENGGSLVCICQSGDIDAQFTEGFESITFKTVSGDISLKANPRIPVNTELSSISGSIDCTRSSVPDGKDVRIRTVSGDIRIR